MTDVGKEPQRQSDEGGKLSAINETLHQVTKRIDDNTSRMSAVESKQDALTMSTAELRIEMINVVKSVDRLVAKIDNGMTAELSRVGSSLKECQRRQAGRMKLTWGLLASIVSGIGLYLIIKLIEHID